MKQVLLFSALLACGGDSSSNSPEQFCESVTRTMCEGNMACCDLEERTHASIDTCLEANLRYCEIFVEDAASPHVRFDADEAAVFETQIRESLSTCSGIEWGLEALRREPDAEPIGLVRVFEATLEDGQRCGGEVLASACIHHCVRDPEGHGGLADIGGPGVCGLGIAEGGVCWAGFVNSICVDGTYCDMFSDGDVRVCVPVGDLGAPCFGSLLEQCRDGLHCGDGACVPNCTRGESCQLGVCGAGLVRDADDVCVERPQRSYCALWEVFG